jgi:bacillithiol biosynthesis deacetylase BshB1
MTTSTIGLDPKLDVLAFGAHPDDVELGCGGTLALLAEAGRQVGIVHLTRGEAGTRGTEETRRAEAVAAAEVLGAQILEIVDCGDGHLRHGDAEEDLVIEILRRYRPDLVLAPTPADRHPDHGRAHRLVSDSCFYAGLAGRGLAGEVGELAPHRPAAMLAYMQHDPFDVSLVVDVSPVWEVKQRALDCYQSQLHRDDEADARGGDDGPKTKVASPEFRRTVEGRARHFGLMIGAAYGEPFQSRLPVAVGDAGTLMGLLPGGIR